MQINYLINSPKKVKFLSVSGNTSYNFHFNNGKRIKTEFKCSLKESF